MSKVGRSVLKGVRQALKYAKRANKVEKKPKIGFGDIETSPCIVETWGLGKQHVSADQVIKERKIICICYKLAGSKKVVKLKMDLSKHDMSAYDDDADREMLKKFVEVYNSCDLWVFHNGRSFDISRIRARLVKFGLPDLAYNHIPFNDSYFFSKDKDFTSHKLDYLCRYLGLPRKESVGRKLWTDVMNSSKRALNKMTNYCANDVVILEKAYNILKPYSKSNLNMSIFKEEGNTCPSCGSKNLIARGHRVTKTGKFRRFSCKDCNYWSTAGKNLIKKSSEYLR